MGNYNTQYQNYYSGMAGKKRTYGGYGYNGGGVEKNSILDGKSIIKRFTFDLIGTLALFIFVIVCKLIVTPETMKIYNYSKEMVNYNYDYKNIYTKLKAIDVSKINVNDIQNEIIEQIDSFKNIITGEETVKDKIRSNYAMPVEGKILTYYGEIIDPLAKEKVVNNGVNIEVKGNADVKAAYNGTVKEIGEDKNYGKYILINHGDGIETKYANLNDVLVKNDEVINKGYIIGKSKAPNLHFEVLYMGENKNPDVYFPNEIK